MQYYWVGTQNPRATLDSRFTAEASTHHSMPGEEAGPQKQLRNDYEVGTEPASGLLGFIPTCKA